MLVGLVVGEAAAAAAHNETSLLSQSLRPRRSGPLPRPRRSSSLLAPGAAEKPWVFYNLGRQEYSKTANRSSEL